MSAVRAVSAVHDGYVLQKSIARAPIGGRLLTQCMLQSVESKGITVRPSYSFKRSINASGQYEVCHHELSSFHYPFPLGVTISNKV